MRTKEDSLTKLLLLIEEICDDPANSWFREELAQKIGVAAEPSFKDFPTFLKHLKKNYKIKAKEFYRNIHNKKLKNELIKDNVEMQWYQATHNVERFLLYTFYQIENLLNYYCIETNSFEKIEKNKNHYQHSFGSNFTVICYDNFFSKKTGDPHPIEKVNSVYAKITYWLKHSNRVAWYSSSSYNMSNLIKVRNKNSHRSSSSQPDENILKTLDILKKQDFSSLSFYINIVKEIVKSIDELGDNTVPIQPVEMASSSKGPKILGKIDLPERKKRKNK